MKSKQYKKSNEQHDFIALKASKFIKRLHNCIIGSINFSGGYSKEIVDGILFNWRGSFLIESKVSIKDFKNDNKKDFRINPEKGIGKYRYYACPKDLIKIKDLPKKWGLIYVDKNGKCEMQIGFKHSCSDDDNFKFIRNLELENKYLMYLAKRYKNRNFLKNLL